MSLCMYCKEGYGHLCECEITKEKETTPAQQEAKRQAEVMIAFSEGKEIECSNKDRNNWDVNRYPSWIWSEYDYRIAVPKPKKVKYCAFEFNDGGVTWSKEGSQSYVGRLDNGMKRIPELDKEVEVVEP